MRAQEQEDFRSFVVHSSPRLLRTAYLLTGDRHEAEDLLQTALARLALAWRRVQAQEALDAYVRRTMVNALISSRRRRRVVTVDAAAATEPTAAAGPDLEARAVLWAALARLPVRQRAVVVLRYWEDLSEAETAQVLGTAIGTVKSQAARALAKLRADTGLSELAPLEVTR